MKQYTLILLFSIGLFLHNSLDAMEGNAIGFVYKRSGKTEDYHWVRYEQYPSLVTKTRKNNGIVSYSATAGNNRPDNILLTGCQAEYIFNTLKNRFKVQQHNAAEKQKKH